MGTLIWNVSQILSCSRAFVFFSLNFPWTPPPPISNGRPLKWQCRYSIYPLQHILQWVHRITGWLFLNSNWGVCISLSFHYLYENVRTFTHFPHRTFSSPHTNGSDSMTLTADVGGNKQCCVLTILPVRVKEQATGRSLKDSPGWPCRLNRWHLYRIHYSRLYQNFSFLHCSPICLKIVTRDI